jgi:O-antigen/teichoic acid export membrane protein
MSLAGRDLARPLRDSLALLLAGKAASMLLALVATVILTRSLQADGFGLYRTVVVYLGVASIVASLGLNLLVVRDISRPDADQARILGNAVTLRLLTGVVGLGAAAAAVWFLPFDPAVRVGVVLGAVGSLAQIAYQLLVGLFQQRLRQLGAVAAEVTGAALLVLGALALTQAGADLLAFVAATAVSQICTLAVGWWFAQRLQPFRPRFEPAELTRLLRAGAPIGALIVLSMLYARADTLLLALLAEPTQVGLYGLATRLLDTIGGVTLLAAGLIAPMIARHALHDRAAFRDLLDLALTAVLVWTVGVAALLAWHSAEVSRLIGGDPFAAAGPALTVLALVAPISAVGVVFRDAAIALEQQRVLFGGYVAAVAIAGLGYLLLIPRLAALGAALGLLLGELTVATCAVLVVTRATGVIPALGAAGRTVASGVAAAAVGGALKLAALPWPATLIASAAAYGGLLLLTKAVAPATIRELLTLRRAERSVGGGS